MSNDPPKAPMFTPIVCHMADRKGGRSNLHHDVLTQIQTTTAKYPPQPNPPKPVDHTNNSGKARAATPPRYSFQRCWG